MSFIIFFATSIFVFTVRENILLSVIVFVWIMAFSLVFQYFTKRRNKKIFLLISLAFALSVWSFLRKNFDTLKSATTSWSSSFQIKEEQKGKSFMWTGIIKDISSAWKYIFTTAAASYFLQSKQEHKIGEELFLVGSMESITSDTTNNLRTPFRKKSSPLKGTPSFQTKEDSQGDQWFLAFDYGKRLKMKWLKWSIYESNSSVLHTNRAWIYSQIKESLQQKIISSYGKDRISGLLLWMLVGDKSLIPSGDYQNLTNAGLSHLVTVNGANIALMIALLGLLLFFLPFYIRSAVIVLIIIMYGIVCWLGSSVFRAIITGGLSMFALFRGKEVPIWRLLSIAFVAMLIVNPYYLVYDVGFLMSFGAVIGIIYIWQSCKNLQTHPHPLPYQGGEVAKTKSIKFHFKIISYIRKKYLKPSVGATIGIFPIIIFFMGQLNLLSVLANLFVLPLVPFAMIYGFLSIFLFQIFHRQLFLLIEKCLLLYIYKVAELFSTFGLYLSMEAWAKWVVLLGFLLWFILARSWKFKGRSWKLKAKTAGLMQ